MRLASFIAGLLSLVFTGCYSAHLVSTSMIPAYVCSDDWGKAPGISIDWPELRINMPSSNRVSELWMKPIVKEENGQILLRARWWPYEIPKTNTYDLRKWGIKQDSAANLKVLWINPNGKTIALR